MKTLFYLFLLISINAFADEYPYFNGVEHIVDTDSITVAWAPVLDATGYEVKIIWTDPSTPMEYAIGSTTNTEIVINKRRSGHFKVKVRAYKETVTTTEYSDWADSLVQADSLVNNFPMPWKLFWKVAPPGPPIIE